MRNPFKSSSKESKTQSTKSENNHKSEHKVCVICKNSATEDNQVNWKRIWFCKKCYETLNFNLDDNCIKLSNNEILFQSVFANGMCPIPSTILERLEKSPDFSPLIKRTKYFAVDRVLGYLHLETAYKKRITKWSYGTNKEIWDDFDSGYTAQFSLEYNDAKLRKIIVGILRDHGFGCLVSEYGALGHKNEDFPTSEGIEKLIESITTAINQDELSYNQPDWIKKSTGNS